MFSNLKRVLTRFRLAKQWLSRRRRLGRLKTSDVELRRVPDRGAYEGNWTRLLMPTSPAAQVVMADANMEKMDVQGAESDFIRGGQRIVRNSRHLLLELQAHDYDLGAPHFAEAAAFLHAEGFAVVAVVDLMYSRNKLIQADVLFLNKKLP